MRAWLEDFVSWPLCKSVPDMTCSSRQMSWPVHGYLSQLGFAADGRTDPKGKSVSPELPSGAPLLLLSMVIPALPTCVVSGALSTISVSLFFSVWRLEFEPQGTQRVTDPAQPA
jgi:hypothetical protein